ncbi:ALDH-like protein [Glarea lozoyensis ATCC 20868]|uniref:ALDH-like protein n=1 Tax=Glarea lozoyensis (strain ATCC 20868 / MF5171) TaxID=1116229 RepID=S3DS78_GLAL2|nr:ALDH-like protein [Glarea lozoyensis ATCC 20868]EPE34796.1 ALDH-like protein [Glarea lozoyensis ATCC 20868]
MEKVRGTIIDGRLENVRYRQYQLQQLHLALRNGAEQLQDALCKDSGISKTIAKTEFYLAMDSVNKAYETLDFDQALKDEYLIKDGKDNLNSRSGLGVIAFRPGTHSRLYSIVTVVAMAIAAKNALYLESLSNIIASALDKDLFAVSSKFSSPDISGADLFIDGTAGEEEQILTGSGTYYSKSLAVVDRSADLKIAVRAIVNSRLPHNCNSPYSPGLVIVHEFVKDSFEKLCLEYAKDLMTVQDFENFQYDTDVEYHKDLVEAESLGQITLTKLGVYGLAIVESRDSNSALIATKTNRPYIHVLSSTGIVDTTVKQQGFEARRATYLFATPSVAKFMSEQIPAAVSYVDQIPRQLLIGPVSSPHSLHPRYTTEMLSVPRPKIINTVATIPSSVEELHESALQPLKPVGQKMGHALGFFEQGIFIGLGMTFCIFVPLATWFSWIASKRVLALWG